MEKVYHNPTVIEEDKGMPNDDATEKPLEPQKEAKSVNNIIHQDDVLSVNPLSFDNTTKKESAMPAIQPLDIIPHEKIAAYLENFRHETSFEGREVQLSTETVPFNSGAVVRMEFGSKKGDVIYPLVKNVEDVRNHFGAHFYQKLRELQKEISEKHSSLDGSFVLLGGDIVYLLKGNSEKNWNLEAVRFDINVIKELVKKVAKA